MWAGGNFWKFFGNLNGIGEGEIGECSRQCWLLVGHLSVIVRSFVSYGQVISLG